MSRDLRIRGNDYAGRSHIARGATREPNIIQLAGCKPLHPVNSFAWSRGKKDHASFPSRAALKLAQLSNAMVEIAKSFTFFLICLFGGLVITGTALSPFIYLSFFRLH